MPCDNCGSRVITLSVRQPRKVCAGCGAMVDRDLEPAANVPPQRPVACGARLEIAHLKARAEYAERLARSRLARLAALDEQLRNLRTERNHARAEAEWYRHELRSRA